VASRDPSDGHDAFEEAVEAEVEEAADAGVVEAATEAALDEGGGEIEVVPDGKVIDFIDGKLRNDTPEEYVRQNVERSLVLEYLYPRDYIRVEYGIKSGSRRPRADIVIFHDPEKIEQAGARIICETKQKNVKPSDKKEGVGQLHSYMANCPNCEYGLWTNGVDRLCFAKKLDANGMWEFPEVVDLPAFGLSLEEAEKPKLQNLKAATGDNLLFAFRRCHNYIAPIEGRSKESSFWELLKLIFAKIEDERSYDLNFYVTSAERASDSGRQKTRRRIAKLFEEKVVKKYPELFKATETVELKPETVAYIVAQLQGYSLLKSSVDVKGVAYEEIVGSNLRGDRGEFFTPRNACRMAVEMLDPDPGELVLDPACGTAGFLITAMNHVLAKIEASHRAAWSDSENPEEFELAELYRARGEYLRDRLRGLDLNPELVKAARMNMVMNNDGYGGIHQADSLDFPKLWSSDAQAAVGLGQVDVLFMNPPFGTKIRIDGTKLEQYELAAQWDWDDDDKRHITRIDSDGRVVVQASQPPELLFIERALQFVKRGTGRIAMVVPNGILNNPGLAYVRDWLTRRTQILGIVDMQRDLFQPHNDTQTSMVFLRRLGEDEDPPNTPVFLAVADKIGHDKRGKTIYVRDEEGMDIVVTRYAEIEQVVDGKVVKQVVESKEPVKDDHLPLVPLRLRDWLAERLEVVPAWRGGAS
jgi:type I restriction enzyme M protein